MKCLSYSFAALACIALVACESNSPSPSLVSDAVVTADVAASSGDAIRSSLDDMVANELFGGLANSQSASLANPSLVDASRTRTCYDANGAVVAGCSPMSSVRKIVVHAQFVGTRSGTRETTGGASVTWSGAVHRIADDTLVRNFNTAQPPAEVSRTHTNLIVTHDTTNFTDGTVTRNMTEAARDSVKQLTWNLPHSSNPWPVSGSIVRTDTIKVVATKDSKTESRELVRRIEVIFPADAQGNVVLKINDKTCSLNLVTRRVSNCQ